MSWTQVTSKNQQALQNALMYSGLVNPPSTPLRYLQNGPIDWYNVPQPVWVCATITFFPVGTAKTHGAAVSRSKWWL